MGSHNVADDEIKAIFADVGAGQGPPLGIDAHDIIERGDPAAPQAASGTRHFGHHGRGDRGHRARFGQHTGGPVPVQPAGPGISLETVADTPSPGSSTTPRPSPPVRRDHPQAPGFRLLRTSPPPDPELPRRTHPARPCSPRPPPGPPRPSPPRASRCLTDTDRGKPTRHIWSQRADREARV